MREVFLSFPLAEIPESTLQDRKSLWLDFRFRGFSKHPAHCIPQVRTSDARFSCDLSVTTILQNRFVRDVTEAASGRYLSEFVSTACLFSDCAASDSASD
jgi:hypothetical protein